jgi:hypothetical protein
MRRDIEFRTEDDVILRGWHYLPDRAGPTPTVVMAHEYSAVKEMYLDRFAEAFAEAGIGAVVFDNRNFGVCWGTLVPPPTALAGSGRVWGPQEWGPRGDRVHAIMALGPCSACGYDKLEECPNDHLCMKQIAPETIADQAIAMLSGSEKPSSPGKIDNSLIPKKRWRK